MKQITITVPDDVYFVIKCWGEANDMTVGQAATEWFMNAYEEEHKDYLDLYKGELNNESTKH